MKEYDKSKFSLIEKVNAVSPDIAKSFVLKTYSWPAAVLHRIGYYVEIGAEIEPALEYALRQLSKPKIDSKRVISEFITEQSANCAQVSVLNQYQENILASTGIHVVNLTDPFAWNANKAFQTQSLICDLAGIARNTGTKASEYFGLVMGAETDYFGRCIIDLNQTIKSFSAARK